LLVRSNGQLISDRNGNPSSALRLSGGFASVPASVYFDPATGGFTFMAWIQVFSYNNWERIFDFGLGQQDNNILLALPERRNRLRLDVYNGGGSVSGDFGSSIDLNQWYHIAVSVTGAISSFYIDGLQQGGGSGRIIVFSFKLFLFICRSF